MTDAALSSAPTAQADYSRFVQRVRRRYADELACLPPGPPQREDLETCLQTLLGRGLAMPAALRVLRHLTLERLAVRDCEAQAPLADKFKAFLQAPPEAVAFGEHATTAAAAPRTEANPLLADAAARAAPEPR